jgi:hypothetical protein
VKCAKASAKSKWRKIFCFVSPTFLLKIFCRFYGTAFALSTMFWCIIAKCRCCQKHQKLYAQELICIGTKNVGDFDPRQVQALSLSVVFSVMTVPV